MLTYSKILNKYYDADNDSVVYVTNMLQNAKYMKYASEDLVDIIYSEKKSDTLVFVFLKTARIKELYRKWKAHELD